MICGAGIVEYEHIDPPFIDAKEHSAAGIVLLCPSCHAKKSRSFISPDYVLKAAKSPKCLERGFASDWIGFGSEPPTIKFAGVTFQGSGIPLLVEGFPVLKVRPGAVPGEPFRISAAFWNSRGQYSLGIFDNEWRAIDSNWDFEAVGGALTVRDALGQISLRLRLNGENEISIDSLNMYVRKWRFIGDDATLSIIDPAGKNHGFSGITFKNFGVGIRIGSSFPMLYESANDPEIDGA